MERTIFSISSYISIGAGVFLGGLALLGIITGGAAFAILGGVGLVLAAVAAVFVLFAVIEGDRERSVCPHLNHLIRLAAGLCRT
jgi:hypothetical protein